MHALNECGLQGALASLIEATLRSLMSSSAAETIFVSENTRVAASVPSDCPGLSPQSQPALF